MVKNVNGDVYSDLITIARPEVFWSGGARPQAIRYIVIHGTATTNVVGAYSTWLKSRNYQTSANYLVTDSDIMGCVGENFVAWHSGGRGAITNENSIGIEHINSYIGNLNDASTYLFSDRTLENGARLTAEICKRLGLAPDRSTIKMHREVSQTACPQTLNIDDYVRRVQKYYNGGAAQPTPQAQPQPAKTATPTGGLEMEFTFRIEGDPKRDWRRVYYANSARGTYHWLTNEDELKIIRQIYKDGTGRDLPHYVWNTKAPWYNRAFAALNLREE
ncbi:peptidoglycan recognition protein family protein [Streptococcus sciuri]|uniref:N-acetylmuramoyl-L-alanine amidase n=1 Tax=Streptococcus sciuri TaxID=2973939 RepID=A0ABT2F979_9STRE|nr:peptidoglycan recognition family protein [Streptococcus sciuri]MCS4488367.1 N-acetylmuramoyl-L-alanine amidase [Streptococcus sciuri]